MRTYQFVYNAPTKVYFGDGAISHLLESVRQFGGKVLFAYSAGTAKSTGLYDEVTKLFRENGVQWWELNGILPNPRLSSVVEGAKLCREHGIEVVLGVGGGSVLDCAKAVCAAACYEGDPWDLALDRSKIKKALPLITVCTMASTGSEMDAGAVITNPAVNAKININAEILIPKVSILDPKYTYSAPARHVSAGAADIFIHSSETYFDSADDLYLQDGFAEAVMKTVVKYGPLALKERDNFEARANLLWAAPWAINGLARGGRVSSWTLHGMQHPIGAYYDIIHGEGLAILMPHWMRYILGEKTQGRFVKYGVNVFGIDASLPPGEIAKKAIEATEDLFFNKMKMPRTLSEIGVKDEHFDDIAAQAVKRGGTYVPLTKEDALEIYKRAM